ncbi:MAG TPA: hypothetical protein VGO01_16410 [Bradyrhizobium sp.]|jgi:hypothetical protein|nr:hypothetical protein [Bradyrhizobium sp.]
MAEKPITQFGKRRPVVVQQAAAPAKRSSHVALLLAGTVAVGGGAYALMPGENCAPSQPGMAAPANAGCSPRWSSSSGGGGSSRYGFYSGDSTANKSASGTSPSSSGNVTRGGFGSFAHAFTSHFSGGG